MNKNANLSLFLKYKRLCIMVSIQISILTMWMFFQIHYPFINYPTYIDIMVHREIMRESGMCVIKGNLKIKSSYNVSNLRGSTLPDSGPFWGELGVFLWRAFGCVQGIPLGKEVFCMWMLVYSTNSCWNNIAQDIQSSFLAVFFLFRRGTEQDWSNLLVLKWRDIMDNQLGGQWIKEDGCRAKS